MTLVAVILIALAAVPLAAWLPWWALVPAGALLALLVPSLVGAASVRFRRGP